LASSQHDKSVLGSQCVPRVGLHVGIPSMSRSDNDEPRPREPRVIMQGARDLRCMDGKLLRKIQRIECSEGARKTEKDELPFIRSGL
jgi:hypothetical protein